MFLLHAGGSCDLSLRSPRLGRGVVPASLSPSWCLRDQLLWIRAWSRKVCSRLPRERLRLRGCSHEGSRVRLPRWWFRPLLPRACRLRRFSPRGGLDSVELLRACLRRRSCLSGSLIRWGCCERVYGADPALSADLILWAAAGVVTVPVLSSRSP